MSLSSFIEDEPLAAATLAMISVTVMCGTEGGNVDFLYTAHTQVWDVSLLSLEICMM